MTIIRIYTYVMTKLHAALVTSAKKAEQRRRELEWKASQLTVESYRVKAEADQLSAKARALKALI
ncbi:hypothetical protein [Pseudomonas asplenii]|uniref:hypothetical protein n=1 Tax=Pseudomonas asplenii TaxID=53407 RepID=UPI0006B67F87|nr:hypothetical protein [Pseudomonas fuscovaginae]KPA96914.1 hypothetical protein PF70_03070 [Pseudomonas fuscovaginae]